MPGRHSECQHMDQHRARTNATMNLHQVCPRLFWNSAWCCGPSRRWQVEAALPCPAFTERPALYLVPCLKSGAHTAPAAASRGMSSTSTANPHLDISSKLCSDSKVATKGCNHDPPAHDAYKCAVASGPSARVVSVRPCMCRSGLVVPSIMAVCSRRSSVARTRHAAWTVFRPTLEYGGQLRNAQACVSASLV